MSAPMSLVSLFCKVDDFCIFFENHLKDTLIGCNLRKERRRTLCISEVMTIIIFFHQRHYPRQEPKNKIDKTLYRSQSLIS